MLTSEKIPLTTDKNRLGMIGFIASEIIFFGMLIMAFVYFRFANPVDFRDNATLEFSKAAIFTAFLLASSLSIWFAELSLNRRNRRGVIIWLIVTIGLGAIFLAGQGSEYATLFGENITISRNTFGTAFFTLTGFHGMHVFGGLVALTVLTLMALGGSFKGPHSSALGTVSLYWHFVDVVWICVFTVVYILR